jgi:tryptophan halogenase
VRSRPWLGNVVAVGPAGGDAPALDGGELLLLQLAIAQLVLLWPIDRTAMPEADIYNEEIAGAWARVTDFTAQHFRLNRRAEPFWDAARAAPISAELASKIDLFAARGMFAHFNHEAHVEDSWALVMAGHGVVPRSFDPQASLVDDQALMAEFQRQLRAVATDVHAMETHADALRRMRG